jgi:hypothetical protein
VRRIIGWLEKRGGTVTQQTPDPGDSGSDIAHPPGGDAGDELEQDGPADPEPEDT